MTLAFRSSQAAVGVQTVRRQCCRWGESVVCRGAPGRLSGGPWPRDASAARTLPTISSLPVRTGWTSRPEADQAARKVAVVPHGHDVSVLRSTGSHAHASNIRRQGPGPHRLILVRRRPGRPARRQRRPRRPQPHPTDISAWLRILVGTCQASASITWLISEPAALRRLLQAERWGTGGGVSGPGTGTGSRPGMGEANPVAGRRTAEQDSGHATARYSSSASVAVLRGRCQGGPGAGSGSWVGTAYTTRLRW